MKAYKGFNADMTCSGFKFEIGKTYEESDAKLCEVGFHACLDPLECYHYYPPNSSVYCEVDIEDNGEKIPPSTKVVGKKITIVRQITLDEIVRIHNSLLNPDVSYTVEVCASSLLWEDGSFISGGHNSAILADSGSSISAGNYSAISAGNISNISAGCGSSLSAGDFSTISADNNSSLSAGCRSSLSARINSAISAGNASVLSAGDYSVLSAGLGSILTVFNGRCKAGMNSVIAIADRGLDGYVINCAVGIVDGVHLLPDVWYVNRGGKLVKWEEVTQ